MIVIGLTGSIGMGKSAVAEMLRQAANIPVHDSDACVHEALRFGGAAYDEVRRAFRLSGLIDRKSKAINRGALGRHVFGNDAARRRLESILHPLVRQSQAEFILREKRAGRKAVALDIPLLFETGAQARVNVVFVASAPYEVQRGRVLSRPNMDEKRFHSILASQMPDKEKRRYADYIIPTGLGRAVTMRAVKEALIDLGLLEALLGRAEKFFDRNGDLVERA